LTHEKNEGSFMGRIGVSLLDVEKAALELQGRGKNPSVDAIREVLGTGSKSTIAQHLRDFKAKESHVSGKLPHELVAVVSGLWERLNAQSDARITEIEAASQEEVQELKRSLIALHQDYDNVQKQLHHSEEEAASERTAKEQFENLLRVEQQEHAKLQERHQATLLQLEDNKAENMRLYQLANNIQANLEHYQNAAQQLRTEQALEMERQQTQSQQALMVLKQELVMSQTYYQEAENKLNHKSMEFNQLQSQYDASQQAHEKLLAKFQEHNYELIVYKERCEQQQKNLQSQDRDLAERTNMISQLEKQLAILSDQVNRLEKHRAQAEDKIEALRQEKLFLTQEKAELQGCLRQLETIK
jgi:chromosome segregation ATPase